RWRPGPGSNITGVLQHGAWGRVVPSSRMSLQVAGRGHTIRSPYAMKLVTYDRGGARRLGAWVAGAVVDLPDAVGHPAFPTTLEVLVARNGGTTQAAAREALSRADDVQEFAVPRARLLAPLVADSPGRPGVDERARTMLGP